MKLRIRDNSIRLRLTRSEVELVRDDGLVRDRVPFAGRNNFDACLAPREGEDETDMYPYPEAGTENG